MGSMGTEPQVFDDGSTLEGDPRWIVVQRVVRSSTFSRAAQLRAILLFVVRHTINHPEEPIPEFEIGYRVLGRRKDFNPLDDNIVRVQMGHLRKKLEQYFSTEGIEDEIVIFIPQRSYKPCFSSRAELASSHLSAQAVLPEPPGGPVSAEKDSAAVPVAVSPHLQNAPNPAPPFATVRNGRWIAASLILLALAAFCVVLWNQDRALQRTVDSVNQPLATVKDMPTVAAFWTDFLASSPQTDVVTGDAGFSICQRLSGKVFPLEDYVTRDFSEQLRTPSMSPDLHNSLLVISRLDITSSSEFNVMRRILALDTSGHRIHYYKSRNFVADMFARDNVVLLGNGLSNPFEQPFRDRMNFVANAFVFNSVTNRAPAAGEQRVYASTPDTKYGVVAYLPLPNHQGKVILLDGTGAESVEAEGEFLLAENQLSNFQKQLHVDKLPYFEVLLKMSTVRGTPLDSTIVAYRTYPNLH